MKGSLQTKHGKYYVVVYNKNTQKYVWLPTNVPCEKGHKKEAERKMRELITKFELEMGTVQTDISVSDYCEKWLSTRKKDVDNGYLDQVTYDNYESEVRNHIMRYFKDKGIKLKKITREDIQAFVDFMSKNGKLNGKGGLSPKTVRELRNQLSMILDLAVEDGILLKNPCDKKIRTPSIPKRTYTIFSEDEARQFLEAIKDERIFPIIVFILLTGARKSEALGLRWRAIDFQDKTFMIEHTVVQTKSGIVTKDKTKTESSHRLYAMSDELLKIFLELQDDEKRNRELFGKEYNENDYVFKWENGTPYRPDYILSKVSKLEKKYGFKKVNVHNLRHSCATILHEKGWDIKDISDYLGHGNIQTTANIYVDMMSNERKKDTITSISSGFSSII